MQDLEQRYFERVHAAQTKYNEAIDAARSEHDLEVLAAREELTEQAGNRFNVLFGRAAAPAPSEQVRNMLENMIGETLNRRLADAQLPKPTSNDDDAPAASEAAE